jgi:hypothetical protein
MSLSNIDRVSASAASTSGSFTSSSEDPLTWISTASLLGSSHFCMSSLVIRVPCTFISPQDDRKQLESILLIRDGGRSRTRTCDPLITPPLRLSPPAVAGSWPDYPIALGLRGPVGGCRLVSTPSVGFRRRLGSGSPSPRRGRVPRIWHLFSRPFPTGAPLAESQLLYQLSYAPFAPSNEGAPCKR